ncbi:MULTISPECIES: hypothetical protein [unclassified Rhodococcus (in: high G+C Gram-positive bacteria)]|uniref:hypothetical protein n=1 Tax=unclassified Rhodococcus (in: high G+C Gram-positive bacteria) TaxID=192944 RepID=UPI00211ABD69|nr:MULTISPECIES: hypothetical protein [unclassified Rhodococcus (in: high G+C Gram-positive bacteria)]
MRRTFVAATRVATVVVSGLAFSAIIGAGVSHADTQDCSISRDAFGASAACHDTGAPPGREYVLITECWGFHVTATVPFLAVGPYTSSSRSFVPTGQASGNCGSSWDQPTSTLGVVTGAHVEIYRQ